MLTFDDLKLAQQWPESDEPFLQCSPNPLENDIACENSCKNYLQAFGFSTEKGKYLYEKTVVYSPSSPSPLVFVDCSPNVTDAICMDMRCGTDVFGNECGSCFGGQECQQGQCKHISSQQ